MELRKTLHERGLRMTPQRQLVLDAVHELVHGTPEQICALVQETAPAVNITTVYRTLELLEELGLVRHTHLGHGAPRYSTDAHQHVHLVCHQCSTVTEIPIGELDELAAALHRQYGFALDPAHLSLSGRCADCAAQPAAHPTTTHPTTTQPTTQQPGQSNARPDVSNALPEAQEATSR